LYGSNVKLRLSVTSDCKCKFTGLPGIQFPNAVRIDVARFISLDPTRTRNIHGRKLLHTDYNQHKTNNTPSTYMYTV